MLNTFPLLSFLIWMPVLGGMLVLATGDEKHPERARIVALTVSILCLLFCVPLFTQFDIYSEAWQFREHLTWIPTYKIYYDLGVDGISAPLILLTTYTTLLVILGSWRTIRTKVSQYLAAFLIMQGMIIGVFSSLDSILFYVFWEGMLIPMYLSIGIWGSENRSYAAIKFFLYTFLGSALMLVALLFLGLKAGSFFIPDFYPLKLSMNEQVLLFLGFLLAFAVKIPMFPVHTWLPDAHTEAPAGGSVILAALMLKIGGYGFLRFSLPITPDASHLLDWMMIVLSLIAIVYIGFIAIAQTDMKRLIAYSSVAHMGFVTLGCFMLFIIFAKTGNIEDAYMSLEGAMVQMISHAFGAGAMFLGFGMLYEQYHTRQIKHFGGIAQTMPIFTAFYMIFAMSNVALPGTSGFVGEFLIILSSFKASFWITAICALTLIIGASYTLWMFKRVFFGPIVNEKVAKLVDINRLEIGIFILLVIPIFFIGLYPKPLLSVLHTSIGHLLELTLQSKL